MTTITISTELIAKAMRLLDQVEPDMVFTASFAGEVSGVVLLLKDALSAPATAPEQPAWHDAPTCAGVWICDEDDICYTWTAHSIEILDQFDPGEGMRWFGPIPEDRP